MVEQDTIEDDMTYPVEDVERFMQETAEEVLKDETWDEIKVPHLINQICEQTTKKLITLGKPYKFVVTCVMQQRGGSSHATNSCHQENTTDGVTTYVYPPIARAAKDPKSL